MSAAARFFVFRVWEVKMSSFVDLEGRVRPVDETDLEGGWVVCWARMEDRVLVKATEEGGGAVSLGLEGRGTLYREDLVVIINGDISRVP